MKKEIEAKLYLAKSKLELMQEMREHEKKTTRTLIFVGLMTLIIVFVSSFTRDKVTILDVFSMSVVVTSLHKLINDSFINKRNDEHEIAMINLEIKHLETVLEEYEKKEDGKEAI